MSEGKLCEVHRARGMVSTPESTFDRNALDCRGCRSRPYGFAEDRVKRLTIQRAGIPQASLRSRGIGEQRRKPHAPLARELTRDASAISSGFSRRSAGTSVRTPFLGRDSKPLAQDLTAAAQADAATFLQQIPKPRPSHRKGGRCRRSGDDLKQRRELAKAEHSTGELS